MSDALHTAALCMSIRRIWALTWILLVVMSGFRAAFLLQYAHPEVFEQFLSTLSSAFLIGVLHDLRVLLYILLPLSLSLLWMRDRVDDVWRRWLRRAARYSFVTVSVILITLGSDQIYYAHFQSHINILVFAMLEDDFLAILRGAFENYPVVLWVFLVLAVLTIIRMTVGRVFRPEGFLGREQQPPARTAEKLLNLHLVCHVAALAALSLGGTVPALERLEKRLPESPFLRQLPPNAVELLAETVWTRMSEQPYSVADRFAYGQDLEAAVADFTDGEATAAAADASVLEHLPLQRPLPQPPPRAADQPPPHVVLVVMESFATHLVRWQSEDFDLFGPLARWWVRGFLFERFLPSDNGSAGSILALTLDLPYRPGTKMLSQSEQKEKRFPHASARQFAAQGYQTAFFYGGPLEWRELDTYLPRQGFDTVVGQAALVEQLGLDPERDLGEWGVWDEHLWTAVHAHLRDASEPQFVVVFTTSHHRPHTLPADTVLPELTVPDGLLPPEQDLSTVQGKQLVTYQYAAHELGRWLDALETDGLAGRTVVGVTGDHTSGMGIAFTHREQLLVRAVPFLVLLPEPLRAVFAPDLMAPGSHKDIVPTLLHGAGLSRDGYRGLGVSLLDPAAEHLGFNASGLLLHPDGAVQLRRDGLDAFAWDGDGLELVPSTPGPEALEARRRYQAAMAIADWIVYEP